MYDELDIGVWLERWQTFYARRVLGAVDPATAAARVFVPPRFDLVAEFTREVCARARIEARAGLLTELHEE